MINKVVFIIFLLLMGIESFSQQERLNKVFVIDNNNFINTIFPTDSGYVLGCWYDNSIVFIDSSANTKWVKSYPYISYSSGLDMAPNALHKSIEGNYYAGGTIQNGLATVNKVYMIRYSNQFDTLSRRVLLSDSTNCNGCLHIHNSFKNSNGDYVFIGMHTKDSANIPLSYGKGLLLIADSDGTLKNRKVLGLNNDDNWFVSGLQMDNYYYLFGATRSYAPVSVTDPWDRTDGWVVKTDLQGNELTSVAFGNPNYFDSELNYAIKLSGNRILTGRNMGIGKDPSGFGLNKPWLFILNENLDVVKETFLRPSIVSGDTLFSLGITDVTLGSDTCIYALGVSNIIDMSAFETLNSKGTLIKMDTLFRIKYFREYHHQGSVFNNIDLNVITSTSDSGFIFGGSVIDNTLTPTQQAWLVKTDSLGCDGLHSCNDTALTIQILQPPDTICLKDTTWLHLKFKGRSAPYFIYANNTLALDSIYYPYTLPLWIDTIMPYVPQDSGIQQIIIKVKDPWGWHNSDTVQIFVKNCHSGFASEEFYKYKIEIYPNPATTAVHIRIRGELYGEYTVTLYNMQGNPIQQITTSEPETILDISQYPQGVYNIRVLGNNMARSEKVVKSDR